MPYRLDESTGLIDYDKLDELAKAFRPKIIIAVVSLRTRERSIMFNAKDAWHDTKALMLGGYGAHFWFGRCKVDPIV